MSLFYPDHTGSMLDFESLSWEHLVIYWFQGRDLLVDDQNLKTGEDVKNQGGFFFPFLSIKMYITFSSCYSCFSGYCTKREMPRIKLMTALSF